MMISQCTEKSLIVITKCCKLCLYMGLCVCVLQIGMRGRKKIISHILRLYCYWLVCVQKDVQWQNSFTSNLKQPKGIFCYKESIFYVHKNFSSPYIYPFCHHEKKKVPSPVSIKGIGKSNFPVLSCFSSWGTSS